MSSSLVLSVSGLSKRFCRDLHRSHRYALADIGRELLGLGGEKPRLRKDEFWALDNVSLTLESGRSLAVVGANGSGKSTLLKIISGLLKPDAGEVQINGSVGAIIELGSNLTPFLTGRENIAIGAASHRLSSREARGLLDAVVDFADIGCAIDAPLQSYSSGMKARLAFALAAQLRHELLLIDEALAVGDLQFQRKCIQWMHNFQDQGGSLIFVSHVLQQVHVICSEAILLDRGKLIAGGDTPRVVRRYLETGGSALSRGSPTISEVDAALLIEGIELLHCNGNAPLTGSDAILRMRINVREPLAAYWGVTIWSADGATCITSSFARTARTITAGRTTVECFLSRLPLVPGRYLLRPMIADDVAHVAMPLAGAAAAGIVFEVAGDPDLFTNGELQLGQVIAVEASWSFESPNSMGIHSQAAQ